jgi:hypothetical protein
MINFDADELELLEKVINSQIDDMGELNCNSNNVVERLEKILSKIKAGAIRFENW